MRRYILWLTMLSAATLSQAAPLNVEVNEYVLFTDATSPDTAEVKGTLRVASGALFTPSRLDLTVGFVGAGAENPNAPSGERNGDVYLDGGTINIGTITTSTGSRLFVNSTTYVAEVIANDIVTVNSDLIVTGTPATYSSSARTVVTRGATLQTGTFAFTNGESRLTGEGSVTAGTFDFANTGSISPGDDDSVAGTLSLSSTSIDISNVGLVLDFVNAPSGTDLIAIDGAVTGTAFVLPFFVGFTASELAAHEPFVFMTAEVMLANFVVGDEPLTEVRDENGVLVGNMVIETSVTSAYFTFQPVPEPGMMGVLSMSVLSLRRRRLPCM